MHAVGLRRPLSALLPSLLALVTPRAHHAQTAAASPAALRDLAHEYYAWRNQAYPVASSDQGLHTWDDRLTDYSPAAVAARRAHVARLLARVKATNAESWGRDDYADWLLFRAQLERVAFFDRVLRFEETNPQVYVAECANATICGRPRSRWSA